MNKPSEKLWLRICAVDEIPLLGSRVVERDSGNVAIFRTDSEVFALLDRCPHKAGPLSQGIVHGNSVTCPLHSWNIDLSTGEARAPDVGCARRYPVRVDSGDVFLGASNTMKRHERSQQ
ncbi:nitrite reductase small subunit NirD [Uliginosibacterium sp. sgz301328]|uniref:nitrite reductase small subunit NirD n=1 Tax=Uliginosibacterium sp. sgz301328 TaxID=3243764 RepID=UPI00359CE1B7